jgi:biofilm PGA synthesis N-glycosyltransferase PgaC
MEKIIHYIGFAILIYFFILCIGYTVFLAGTFLTIIKKYKAYRYNNIVQAFNKNPLLPITIIIPAYNEVKRISNSIASVFNSDYKNVNIIVVNDGSTDTMLQQLIEDYLLEEIPPAFKKQIQSAEVRDYYQSARFPNLRVIDKEHSPYADSAADSINAGLNACRTPLFITLDADTILEPEALTRMIYMYLTSPHCVAVGGDVYIPDPSKIKEGKILNTNIPSNPLLGVQVCEYLRSFSYGREGWEMLGGALCYPGAFTMLETQAVINMGGYDASNFSYDAEITMRLHHAMREKDYPYSVPYAPSAIVWSEGPHTLKAYWRQRNHWQRGLLRSLFMHWKMIGNLNYGITGLLAFPYYILFEILGPVVEAIAYITLILSFIFIPISFINLGWLLLLAWGYISFITLSCVILSLLTFNKYHYKMDILRIFFLNTLDMVFYRQFRAFCALFSSIEYGINRMLGKPQ